MSAADNPNDALKNHLLAALPADEFRRVKSKLEPLSFKLGEVLYESGDKIDGSVSEFMLIKIAVLNIQI